MGPSFTLTLVDSETRNRPRQPGEVDYDLLDGVYERLKMYNGRYIQYRLRRRAPGGLYREYLHYRFTMREHGRTVLLFDRMDVGLPAHLSYAVDSDRAVCAVMSSITMRPGYTDAEFFSDYTPAQLDFATQHAEALSMEVLYRFGEE